MKLMVFYNDTAAGAALNLASLCAKDLNAKVYVVTSIKGGADVARKEYVRVEKDLKRIVASLQIKQQIHICICCLRIVDVKQKRR